MPSSRQARMTRTAISPRFATRMRLKSGRDAGSEWNVAMLLGRVPVALVLQHLERADEARARVGGLDDLVDVAELGGLVRVGEGLPVLGDQALALGGGILRPPDLVAEDDVDGAAGPHDRDLGGGGGGVPAAPEGLGGQYVGGAAGRLAW